MIIGQAAGVVANMALQTGKPLQEIDAEALSAKLKAQGAMFEWVPPPSGPAFFQRLFRSYGADAGNRSLLPAQ